MIYVLLRSTAHWEQCYYIPNILGSQVFFPILWKNVVTMRETFGQRLRYLRLEKHLSQPELALEIGVGKSIISAWELGKAEPTLSNAVKVATFFDVSLEYLAGIDEL